MQQKIQNIFKKAGLQLKKFPTGDLERRIKIIRNNQIDTILDIGANVGNYAITLRQLGFTGKIISFEPLKKAFDNLSNAARKDAGWIAENFALGDEDTISTINVSGGNSESSSILNMLPAHIAAASESEYVQKEEIQIKKLDSIFSAYCNNDNKVMIKIDTQGYEKNVIQGALKSLCRIQVIQLEMSIIPLYENEMLYPEMTTYLEELGYQLFSIEPGYSDAKTGQLYQMDGVFVRKN